MHGVGSNLRVHGGGAARQDEPGHRSVAPARSHGRPAIQEGEGGNRREQRAKGAVDERASLRVPDPHRAIGRAAGQAAAARAEGDAEHGAVVGEEQAKVGEALGQSSADTWSADTL